MIERLPHLLRTRWVAIAGGALLGVGLALYYVHQRDNYEFCESAMPQDVDGPKGRRISMDVRFCGLLAGDPGTVVVRLKQQGGWISPIVFAYTPTMVTGDTRNPPLFPLVSWVNENRAVVSISQISQIHEQLHDLDGVHFDYKIGEIDYPQR